MASSTLSAPEPTAIPAADDPWLLNKIKEARKISDAATGLDKAPYFKKPIAHLTGYSPFLQVRVLIPQTNPKGSSTSTANNFLQSSSVPVELFSIPPNNIQSFNLDYEAGNGKVTIKFVDVEYYFSDLLLLRLQSLRHISSPYLEIEFGWNPGGTNKEKNVNYTNAITAYVNGFTEDDSSQQRVLTITGQMINILPGVMRYLMPRNVLGPLPLMTYQFAKFLTLDEDGMRAFVGFRKKIIEKKREEIIKDFRNTSKIDDTDAKSAYFMQNSEKIESAINAYAKEIKQIVGKINSKDSVTSEAFPIDTETKKIIKKYSDNNTFDKNIFRYLSIIASEEFYYRMKDKDDAVGILLNAIAPVLRDSRVHPFEALQFFWATLLIEKEKYDSGRDFSLINIDFTGGISSNEKIGDKIEDVFLFPTEKIIGYKEIQNFENFSSTNKAKILNNDDAFIQAFGISVSDITLNQDTSWETIFSTVASHIKINITGETLIKDGKPVKIEKPTPTSVGGGSNFGSLSGRRVQIGKNNDAVFIQTGVGTNSFEAVAQMQGKFYFTSKTAAQTTLNVIINLLKETIHIDGNIKSNRSAIRAPKGLVEKVKNIRAAINTNYCMFFLTDLDINTIVLNQDFALQNVVQGYSYRFVSQKDYLFDPGSDRVSNVNFPDVISFKPETGDLFNAANFLNISDLIRVEQRNNSVRIISEDEKRKIKNLESDISTLNKLKEIERPTDANKKAIEERQKTIDEQKTFLKVKENPDGSVTTGSFLDKESNRLRLRYPIVWDMNFYNTNIYANTGDGRTNDQDAAMMKTSLDNFRKRFILSSMSYPATLEIIGDANYDNLALSNKLIYLKVYNHDGTLSMHTGLYDISGGFSHAIMAGSFKTVLKLRKRPDAFNENLRNDLIAEIAGNQRFNVELLTFGVSENRKLSIANVSEALENELQSINIESEKQSNAQQKAIDNYIQNTTTIEEQIDGEIGSVPIIVVNVPTTENVDEKITKLKELPGQNYKSFNSKAAAFQALLETSGDVISKSIQENIQLITDAGYKSIGNNVYESSDKKSLITLFNTADVVGDIVENSGIVYEEKVDGKNYYVAITDTNTLDKFYEIEKNAYTPPKIKLLKKE